MRVSTLVLWAALQFSMLGAHAAAMGYKVVTSSPVKGASIQTVAFSKVNGLDTQAVGRVNSTLLETASSFGVDARECRRVAQGHPWGYELSVDKVLVSPRYLSVVYSKSTVCGGSPDFEKETLVFSIPSGNRVGARALIAELYPKARLAPGSSRKNELIHLDEQTANAMIEDSKRVMQVYDSRCDFYLKNTGYRIWMAGKNLMLFPEFIQPESFCQKAYLLQPDS